MITKELLLNNLSTLREGNNKALEDEDISEEMLDQEEAIESTFDMVEQMINKLD